MTTIDQIIAEKIGSWYVGEWPVGNLILCTIAVALSFVLCGAIGLERERRGRTAGLRTHLLVGLGSCMVMIISIYGFPHIVLDDGTVLKQDTARLAAQVITGVGFLGAGAIIHRSSGAKGLTTAATIWIVMAIGLACGSMNFLLATGGTILILVFLITFKRFESKMAKTAPMISLTAAVDTPIIAKILELAKQSDCVIQDIHTEIEDNGLISVTFLAVSSNALFNSEVFILQLQRIEGVKTAILMNGHRF